MYAEPQVWYLKELVPASVRSTALNEGCEVYTHDELHRLLAYDQSSSAGGGAGKPLYETFKRDPAKAALDRYLFEAAPLVDRLRLVREEAMAMASERIVVPALLRGDTGTAGAPASSQAASNSMARSQAAYSAGLCMALTTHSKGWFRSFGHAHYPALKNCDVDMEALLVADGRIRPGGAAAAAFEAAEAAAAASGGGSGGSGGEGCGALARAAAKAAEARHLAALANGELGRLASGLRGLLDPPRFRVGDVVRPAKASVSYV